MNTPFTYGKIAADKNFIGREVETTNFVWNSVSLSNTIIIAPRRWGKSSLVNKAAKLAMEQDSKKRYKIRNIDALKRLAHHILNETPTLIVKETLQNIISIKSERTLGNYLMYLNQTYLVSTISKYSSRSRERARNEKSYAIDVAFMDKRENAFSCDNKS